MEASSQLSKEGSLAAFDLYFLREGPLRLCTMGGGGVKAHHESPRSSASCPSMRGYE